MRTVYKYPLKDIDGDVFEGICTSDVELLVGAMAFKVGVQSGGYVLWAEVHTDQQKKYTKRIYIYGTGHQQTEKFELRYLNTFFDGPFVWHAYEAVNVNDRL